MITLSNLISRIPGGIAQGIIWGIMALGIYITFRVLKESDLTVDGSFATGGAVTVMMIIMPKNNVENERVEEVMKLLGLPTADGENI